MFISHWCAIHLTLFTFASTVAKLTAIRCSLAGTEPAQKGSRRLTFAAGAPTFRL